MDAKPPCPNCQQTLDVYKVSHIYGAGITAEGSRSDGDRAILESVFGQEINRAEDLGQAVRLFGPPEGKVERNPHIHPDLLAGSLSLIVIVIIYDTYWTQRGVFWAAVAVWAIAALAYGFARGPMLKRYRLAQAGVKARRKALENAVASWAKLYYCAADRQIFDPERSDSAPLEELHPYIYQS